MLRTVESVIQNLARPNLPELERPFYNPLEIENYRDDRIFLGAEAMKRHTADAGWQLTLGFAENGYNLWGKNFEREETNVREILNQTCPLICVVQDKREWEGKTAGYRKRDMAFQNIELLKERNDIFKLTVLKDAQQKPHYHRDSAQEIGTHAWITYYHPTIVKHIAPYVRSRDLIRTYHSINPKSVPKFNRRRWDKALLSGAISRVYPLRDRIKKARGNLPSIEWLPHPGYKHNGCVTPDYLLSLSKYKVAICTSSIYGYTLRKHIEATAAGCIVITDLPKDDRLPEIDSNLVRVPSTSSPREIEAVAKDLINSWDPARQEEYAKRCVTYYNYQESGRRLVDAIETARKNYNA